MVTELIERVLTSREVEWETTGPGAYVVTLPGTHKLKTAVNLIVGEHALRVEAFVMRRPDERHEELWAWLLRRNARMYGVSFSIDGAGDVYLTGRVSLKGLDEDELDRLLDEPGHRRRLAAGAVAHASQFSWDRTAESLIRVYRDAVSEHRALIAARLEGAYAW